MSQLCSCEPVGLQCYHGARKSVTEVRQVTAPPSSLCLLSFSHFSCMNSSVIVARLWLISKVLKKSILTIIASVFYWFYREQIFRDSFLAILEVLLGHPFLFMSQWYLKINVPKWAHSVPHHFPPKSCFLVCLNHLLF